MHKKRSNEERKKIYNFLIKRKINPDIARRMRDLTQNHINQYLEARGKKGFKKKLSPIY